MYHIFFLVTADDQITSPTYSGILRNHLRCLFVPLLPLGFSCTVFLRFPPFCVSVTCFLFWKCSD